MQIAESHKWTGGRTTRTVRVEWAERGGVCSIRWRRLRASKCWTPCKASQLASGHTLKCCANVRCPLYQNNTSVLGRPGQTLPSKPAQPVIYICFGWIRDVLVWAQTRFINCGSMGYDWLARNHAWRCQLQSFERCSSYQGHPYQIEDLNTLKISRSVQQSGLPC